MYPISIYSYWKAIDRRTCCSACAPTLRTRVSPIRGTTSRFGCQPQNLEAPPGEMGQDLSCNRRSLEGQFFAAARSGEVEATESILCKDPTFIHRTTAYSRSSSLHIAAAKGQVQMLSLLLERWHNPDIHNRHKQTPLMLAAMNGKIACVERLLQAGANILLFDSLNGRTCLHYAAYYGHLDCLRAILQAARSNSVAESWGFARFVNVRDGKGATPLHLAAKQRRPGCVHVLLEEGALVCVSTGDNGYPGSTPLHMAARGGCADCVRQLLAWGADRLQMDSTGRIPYAISVKKKHIVCSALLNPSSPEPLVWPAPLKFISELKQDARLLLETALMEANMEREKKIFKGTVCSFPSPETTEDSDDDDASESGEDELCCICFDRVCSIEVRDCGHQMCARCSLALCCRHAKPDPMRRQPAEPVCPFCRRAIARLAVIESKPDEEEISGEGSMKPRSSRKSRSLSEGSGSFKGFSSAVSSFGKTGGGGSDAIADKI